MTRTMAQEGQQQNPPVLGSRIVALPESFDDGDVEKWLKKFDLCADANGWNTENGETKRKILPTYLKGRAWVLFDRLTAEQKDTYTHLSDALKSVFSPATTERRRLAVCQFKDRDWKSGEPLEVYAGELERLIDRAFPELACNIRQQQLMDRFTEGMPDFVRHELELHAEATMEATITRARELLLLSDRRRTVGGVKAVVNAVDGGLKAGCIGDLEKRLERLELQQQHQQTYSRPSVPVFPPRPAAASRERLCFKCNRPGHLQRDCPLMQSQPRRGGCFVCGKQGHLARDCLQRRDKQPVVSTTGSNAARNCPKQPLPPQQQSRTSDQQRFYQVNGMSNSLVVCGTVNGIERSCLIDTGATVSLVPMTMVSGQPLRLCSADVQLRAVNGIKLQVLGGGVDCWVGPLGSSSFLYGCGY